MSNKLEGIIVAFSYLDILSVTLSRNLEVLDHVIILTKENDPVIDFCAKLKNDKITVVTTDAFTHNGAIYNKGLVICVGFQHVKFGNWIMTLDGDVILPPDFKTKFLAQNPDIENIYGARRYQFNTKEEWEDFDSGKVNLKEIPLYRGYGYGFCTCFNYQSLVFQKLMKENNGLAYPYWIPRAADIDWLFVRNWDNATMVYNDPPNESPNLFLKQNNDTSTGLLREMPSVYHLGMPGLNHEGRATPEF